jgi:hypothetical protein
MVGRHGREKELWDEAHRSQFSQMDLAAVF